jgi:hypothetical protein
MEPPQRLAGLIDDGARDSRRPGSQAEASSQKERGADESHTSILFQEVPGTVAMQTEVTIAVQ